MKYNILVFVLLTLFTTGCSIQNQSLSTVFQKKEKKFYEMARPEFSEDLKVFIKKVAKAFALKDINKINTEFINQKVGIYNLIKVDGITSFTHQNLIYNVIDSQNEELSDLISFVPKDTENFVIIEQDVVFNCSPNDDAYYGWNGEGLYVSDKTNNYLSKMMHDINKYQNNKYNEEDLKIAKFIENSSYKVVLTPDLVFYVNKIDEKWYITLFDRITTDCSSSDIN